MSTPSDQPDRIDLNDKAACESWVRRLNITHEKLREAVGAVGDDARRVEQHVRERGEPRPGGKQGGEGRSS